MFWMQDNGRWMIATPIDFVLPEDRIVEVYTREQGLKKMRLATAPSKESVDREGNKVLLWGKSDVQTTYGTGVRRQGLKGVMS